MNRSYSKIRHIQKLNMILENRILNEQVSNTIDKVGNTMINLGNQVNTLGNMVQSKVKNDQNGRVPGNVPPCVMKGDGLPGSGGSIEGPFDKIESTGPVAPEYQGYIVYKEGKPFCFIKQ